MAKKVFAFRFTEQETERLDKLVGALTLANSRLGLGYIKVTRTYAIMAALVILENDLRRTREEQDRTASNALVDENQEPPLGDGVPVVSKVTTNKVLCPVCGEVNELADADGYTEEYPREWHAACAAFVSTLRTHGAIFDGGSDRSRVDVARE